MKALFVVTAFYPEKAIGSVRISKIAKYFDELGVTLTVVSPKLSPWSERDNTLWFDAIEKIDWITVDQSKFFRYFFRRIRIAAVGNRSGNSIPTRGSRNCGKEIVWRTYAQFLYSWIKAVDWAWCVYSFVSNKRASSKYDFIFCSYPSLGSVFSGVRLKEEGYSRKLIVDFRDSIADSDPLFGRSFRRLKKKLFDAADLSLFISDGVRQNFVGDYQRRSAFVAPNGFDYDDLQELGVHSEVKPNEELFRMVYTGSMYGGRRNLRPLFSALRTVASNSQIPLDKFIFEYAGSDIEVILKQAGSFGVESCIVDHGLLPRSDALRLQSKADLCVLASWNTHHEQGVLTGKIFEYFMLEKTVLAVVDGEIAGSELRKIIEEVHAGYCYESSGKGCELGLVEWLSSVAKEKFAHGSVFSRYNWRVSLYDYRNICRSVLKEIRETVDGRGLACDFYNV